MAVVPVTLLMLSVLALIALGAHVVRASRMDGAARFLRWSGAAMLCAAFGFALLLAAPADLHAPIRVFGSALMILPCGLLWGAARIVNGRSVPFEGVVAGTLAWLVVAALCDPGQPSRVVIVSLIVAASAAAIAWEHRAGMGASRVQRHAMWIFVAHAAFFLLRALSVAASPGTTAFSSGLLGPEAVALAVLVGMASLAMSRERNTGAGRQSPSHDEGSPGSVAQDTVAKTRETLEDPLTGVGNRLAMMRSGAFLMDAMRRAGRPTSLLAMDIDGFAALDARHGRPAAERLLVAFARLAHDYLPPTSLVCRLDDAHFAAVLPGADAARAGAVAEEIRGLFAHLAVAGPQGAIRGTVSIGVAASGPLEGAGTDQALAGLMARAACCLAAAQQAGRDRVILEAKPSRAA